jgi:hypothetical protein
MVCYTPLEAWKQPGKSVLTFRSRDRVRIEISPSVTEMLIPCGQCIGCRLDQSLNWAVRCEHESLYHEECYFLTLTFNDDHLPDDLSLRSWHLQDFWKRVRYDLDMEFAFHDGVFADMEEPPRIKYYACGEYGDLNFRPHYHACVFGLPLLKLGGLDYHSSSGKFSLYRSPWLEKHWPWGFVSVADFSFETAGYCARYCTKKLFKKPDEYAEVGILPERSWISNGLGKSWYQQFAVETWRDDMIVNSRGHQMSVPRAYMKWLESENLLAANDIKKARIPELEQKIKIIDELHSGRHDVAMLVKEASLTAGRLDRFR